MSTAWNPLSLLAQVASEAKPFPLKTRPASSPFPEPLDSQYSASASVTSYVFNTEGHLSSCMTSKRLCSSMRQTSPSSDRLSCHDSHFVPYVQPRKKSRRAELDVTTKMQMKARRKDFMDKANKIKSLENSPVNERQLSVLRMIYDEITMYPCESWMVLVAIIINRAYKQVKNWFSNERQKNRYGESIPAETEEGDKVRLRPSALDMRRARWSDSIFEEVVMIYNYKVQRTTQCSDLSIRRSSKTSDQ